MAQSHKALVAAATKAHDKLRDAIYALAPNNHTKFSDCLAMAPPDLSHRQQASFVHQDLRGSGAISSRCAAEKSDTIRGFGPG